METIVLVERYKVTYNYSLGHCYVIDNGKFEYIGCSLERGWRNNQNQVSCVPVGKYRLIYEKSPKFNRYLWELYDVPNRQECKFHVANYWKQLNGCIALGKYHEDINYDNDPDVADSKNTLEKLHKALENKTNVKIIIRDIKL